MALTDGGVGLFMEGEYCRSDSSLQSDSCSPELEGAIISAPTMTFGFETVGAIQNWCWTDTSCLCQTRAVRHICDNGNGAGPIEAGSSVGPLMQRMGTHCRSRSPSVGLFGAGEDGRSRERAELEEGGWREGSPWAGWLARGEKPVPDPAGLPAPMHFRIGLPRKHHAHIFNIFSSAMRTRDVLFKNENLGVGNTMVGIAPLSLIITLALVQGEVKESWGL